MKPQRSWFWRLPFACALALVAFIAMARGAETADPRATEANITRVTTSLLARSQLAHHPLDTQLAGKLLDRYMDALDGARSLFLRSDLDDLGPLRATLAQKTRVEGDTQPAHVIFARYLDRLEMGGLRIHIDHVVKDCADGAEVTVSTHVTGPGADDIGPMVTADAPKALDALCAMAQGRQPPFIIPKGRRCSTRKR